MPYNWLDHLCNCKLAIAVNNSGDRTPTVIDYGENTALAWKAYEGMKGDGRPKSLCNMGMTLAEENGGATNL